ncbi:phage repressor protein [Haloferax sp. Atlit-6N]|uniref:winged helix-turn-helix domain-containing protein n=1 Tax=Haloferax sp. Atlit-6N TaxID=2077205 RepID=UPI000E255184|nr:winged helix-turn-helix domain-containing protein [Haloferax sp. Atlit-6N]REA03889.1 phage repressor protein [Haloferax sp. Atlit-6N]REA03893.1 phage repressor protein [Haloferax sp. Atlit-6N]
MTGNDDKILELLAQGRLALSKKAIMVNFELSGIDISYSTVKRRLPMLEDAGLVELVREQGGYYRITDQGISYLNEEFEPPEI